MSGTEERGVKTGRERLFLRGTQTRSWLLTEETTRSGREEEVLEERPGVEEGEKRIGSDDG